MQSAKCKYNCNQWDIHFQHANRRGLWKHTLLVPQGVGSPLNSLCKSFLCNSEVLSASTVINTFETFVYFAKIVRELE